MAGGSLRLVDQTGELPPRAKGAKNIKKGDGGGGGGGGRGGVGVEET